MATTTAGRIAAVIAITAAGLTTGATAPARAAADNCENGVSYTVPAYDHSRVMSLDDVGGQPVNVLLPPHYRDTDQHYPVLYLIHSTGWTRAVGAEVWLAHTDLIDLTASGPGVIVVMPYVSPLPTLADWHDGSQRWETYLLATLIPTIDANFRTIADGAHRAIAGASMGGVSATMIIARHPDLFVAAGGFSGAAAYSAKPFPQAFFTAAPTAIEAACLLDPNPIFGDPVTNDVEWHDHSATDLAANLQGRSVYLAAGTGVPCQPEDAAVIAGAMGGESGEIVPSLALEPVALQLTRAVDDALTAAAIDHTAEYPGCGLHWWTYWNGYLHHFYPQVLAAFGRPDPVAFSYRRAAPEFTVWDWTFAADRDRAEEFLDVTAASCHGLTVRGSGVETVTTARCYTPGQQVQIIDDAGVRLVRADRAGRVAMTVDLGPAHTNQQYTPAAAAAEQLAGDAYWRTDHVTLVRVVARRTRRRW
jgi:S-formylglutathione hydrolase FrmB